MGAQRDRTPDDPRLGRRQLLRLAGGSVLGAGLAGLAAACGGDPPALPNPQGTTTVARGPEPDPESASSGAARNVLVVVADDMRLDELEYLPNVVALAEAGVSYTRFRIPTPMCNPARAGFFRGQLATGPNGTGITSQSTGLPVEMRTEILPRWLPRAGMTCGLVGKYLTAAERPLPGDGWSTIVTTLGEGAAESLGYRVWDGEELAEPTRELRQEALYAAAADDFVTRTPEPWFLWFASRSPHTPLQPTDEDAAAMADVEWPYRPDPLEGRPSWLQALPEPTDRQVRLMQGFQRQRLAELQELDRTVGRLLEQLEATGRRERTVVAFVSDNGNAMYEHRIPMLGKGMPYDLCARVPMVLAGGGLPAGVVVDAPTVGPDLTATVLDVAGARARIPQDGVSLLQVLERPSAFADRAVLGHCAVEQAAVPGVAPSDWVATADRKLIRYQEPAGGFAQPTDRYELFDLDADPGEGTNLAWDPAWLGERDALEARLDSLLATGEG